MSGLIDSTGQPLVSERARQKELIRDVVMEMFRDGALRLCIDGSAREYSGVSQVDLEITIKNRKGEVLTGEGFTLTLH